MQPTRLCGAITNNYRLPNFCNCANASLGGSLTCSIGLESYINIGASAWFLPCASPANFGYRARATAFGQSRVRTLCCASFLES